MKKLNLLIGILMASIILSSCGGTLLFDRIGGYTEISGLDFRPYASEGFLFTQSEYTGEYISMGILRITVVPEAVLDSIMPGTILEELRWKISDKDIQNDALEEVYQACIEMGADAFVNMKIDIIPMSYVGVTNPPLVLNSYEISGVAIDRL